MSTDISWQAYANCKGMPVNMFFDDYDSGANSNQVQLEVDRICGNCVVRKQCLEWAIAEGLEGGVFGQKYLKKKKSKKREYV